MENVPNLDAILADVGKFKSALAEIQAGLSRPKEREILGQVLAEIKRSQAEVQTQVPKAFAAIDDSVRQTRAQLQSGQEQLAAFNAKLDAQMAAQRAAAALPPQPPAPPPEPPVDRTLGKTLQAELLAHLAKRHEPENKQPDTSTREVWEDWS